MTAPETAARVARHIDPTGRSTLGDVRTFTGGRAAETFAATLTGPDRTAERVVVRLDTAKGATAGTALATKQMAELLAVVTKHGVLAPSPLCHGPADADGPPFLVTEFLHGHVPSPWSRRDRTTLDVPAVRRSLPGSYARTWRQSTPYR